MAEFVKSLSDIVGHKHIINYLQKRLDTRKVPNVIIFSGVPGIGKTSVAKCLAIEVQPANEDVKSKLRDSIINKNLSTDCIKLFNMSSLDDQEVDNVVAELQSVGMSSTGVKVLLLDEAHGMSKKAQDAILTELEYLPEGVYVFLCTTEITTLRQSLVSRAITLNFNNLNINEIKTLIKRRIEVMGLRFEMPLDMITSIIAEWADNQPRRALNLLESLDSSSVIRNDQLQVFIEMDSVPIIIQLVDYLYGSLTLGIDYLNILRLDTNFASYLIEVLKVALGNTSKLVGNEHSSQIRQLVYGKDINLFMNFVIEVNSLNRIEKRRVVASFMKNHVSRSNLDIIQPSMSQDAFKASDINTIQDVKIKEGDSDVLVTPGFAEHAGDLSDLLSGALTLQTEEE